MPELSGLFGKPNFSKIILPTTSNMLVSLPSQEVDRQLHKAFPAQPPYIVKVTDTVHVMQSLVRPKKITFLCSDGKTYSFLCKPKDDLRRDCRVMDFNDLLNVLFMKDPECRKRDLRIRTYVS